MDTHKINKYLFKLKTVNKNSDQYKKYLFKLKQHGGIIKYWTMDEQQYHFVIMYILTHDGMLDIIKHAPLNKNTYAKKYINEIKNEFLKITSIQMNPEQILNFNFMLDSVMAYIYNIKITSNELYTLLHSDDIAKVIFEINNTHNALHQQEKQREMQKILQNPPPSQDEFLTRQSQQHIIAQHKEFLPHNK